MKQLLLFITLAMLLPLQVLAADDSWVKLNATNFPDANFRLYLQSQCKEKNSDGQWVYIPLMYNSATQEINRDIITVVNIDVMDDTTNPKGTKLPKVSLLNGTYISFQEITNLTGIKLLRNVETIYLPWPGAKNRKTKLKSLDVSGMEALVTITNSLKGAQDFPYKFNNTGASTPTALTSFVCPISEVIAENCPRLHEVRLSGYKSMKKLSLKGSDNIKNLYIPNTGIEELDISNLTNLFNENTTNSFNDQDIDEAFGMPGKPAEAMKLAVTFALNGCSELTKLNLGNVNIHMLDVSGCNKLEVLDLTGQKDLFLLFANMSITTTYPGSLTDKDNLHDNKHIGRNLPAGALKEVIFGEKRIVKAIHIKGCQFETIDLTPIEETVQTVDLSTNNLTSINISGLKKATVIDLDNNRIRKLSLPRSTYITEFKIGWNCLTTYPQFNGKYSPLTTYTKPFQILFIPDNTWKVRVLDNPADAQYVMKENASGRGTLNYYAPKNCRLGDPSKDEYDGNGNPTGQKQDPCYLYFFNTDADADNGIPTSQPRTDAFYYYSDKFTQPKKSSAFDWMKIYFCRMATTPDQIIDLPRTVYYLAGDFNNWQPTERDRFIPDPDKEGIYNLGYKPDFIIERNFRIWGVDPDVQPAAVNSMIFDTQEVSTGHKPAAGEHFYTFADAKIDFGGHADDYEKQKGHNNHVLFLQKIYHKMDTNPKRHYTTWIPDPEEPGKYDGYAGPAFEMKVDESNRDNNYLRITGGSTVGVDDIKADNADTDAPVVYYDLQGRPTDATLPGIYIRRQGTRVTKVIVR